ncbi:putative bifunctional diguanylate cyclase/phosphodiesterase [Pseudoduganella sp. UC29_106]|uniref:putative bifunctional diguanylate cyclase/phosphodiesterase n=1 Tax=Pseudoduganella sp. UC29_106 TaxID=3374553 RepID=UPI003757539A
MANIPDETAEADGRELARIARALATLSAGNRTLLRASDEEQLLREMCHVIVKTGGYRLASVAYAEQNAEKTIRWMITVGTDAADLNAANFTWEDNELGQTATGIAIRTGKPVVDRHLLTDPVYDGPAYATIRDRAIRVGYASVSAFPLRIEGQVLGALIMAAGDSDAFDEPEVKLLSDLADDLAYGIANLRMRIQREEAQAMIARLAYYDALTGLPNRSLLMEELESAIAAAREDHHSLALLHLEVGHFYDINKVLGYSSGDKLLLELGARLGHAVQEGETLARVGEAEFALLLPHADADEAVQVAQRLISTLRKPVEVSDLTLDARVGIGIAVFPAHAPDADSLARRASAAVHQAKPTRGGYAIYTGGQEKEHTRRLALMGDLHRAIEHHELRLYCQPKADMSSRHVCGAEALVRWLHPLKGMISPSEFIPLAEQAGTITPLTNWMLEAAFRQCSLWQEEGLAWPLAVNLSALDLYDPGLIDNVRRLFADSGIAPELIQFELTESALMVDPIGALETLTQLKQLGVQLSIDDFGTGQSGLSYLQRLPVDAVKIDQSFVRPMARSDDSAVIVRSTIELSHNLGLKVVAEGVENQSIWERLEVLGCDVAQGYFISMPMPAAQFRKWASTWA